MPGFDKTGPEGRGSMTGRRLGKCAGNVRREEDDDKNTGFFGFGRGRRGGLGFRWRRGGGFGEGRGFGRGSQ